MWPPNLFKPAGSVPIQPPITPETVTEPAVLNRTPKCRSRAVGEWSVIARYLVIWSVGRRRRQLLRRPRPELWWPLGQGPGLLTHLGQRSVTRPPTSVEAVFPAFLPFELSSAQVRERHSVEEVVERPTRGDVTNDEDSAVVPPQ